MRYPLVLAITLFGVVAAQQGPAPTNVVPRQNMNTAVRRALTSAKDPRAMTGQQIFRKAPMPKVCAIPLLEARKTETHDRIDGAPANPAIDPKMVVAPAVPACSR